MNDQNKGALTSNGTSLSDTDLDKVSGGQSSLTPAQKAARPSSSPTQPPTESVTITFGGSTPEYR